MEKGCCQGLEQFFSPEFFKALCDPNRLTILSRLAQICGPATVSQIAVCCTVDLSVVSRHLAKMRDAKILLSEKKGKEVFYSVNTEHLILTLRQMADAIEACCPIDSAHPKTPKVTSEETL